MRAQPCLKEGKWRGNRTAEWVSPLWATPTRKPAASMEMNCKTLIPAVREYKLVCSSHIWKLSSAFVPSHCNLALFLGDFWLLFWVWLFYDVLSIKTIQCQWQDDYCANVDKSVEWQLAGETQVLGKNQLQCYFAHHKFHKFWPGIETGPLK